MDIRDTLSKEWHGIPVWVILLVVGGGLGLYIRHKNNATYHPTISSDPQSQAALADNSGVYGAIDPNTGIPYSLEGSGLVGSTDAPSGSMDGSNASVYPDIAQEVNDVGSLLGSLSQLGFFPAPGAGQPALIQLPPNGTFYDPNSGQVIQSGPANAPQAQAQVAGANTASMPQSHGGLTVSRGKLTVKSLEPSYPWGTANGSISNNPTSNGTWGVKSATPPPVAATNTAVSAPRTGPISTPSPVKNKNGRWGAKPTGRWA